MVSCCSSTESDLQPLSLLLVPLLHLLQLSVQTLGQLPQLNRLLSIIRNLRGRVHRMSTCSISLHLENHTWTLKGKLRAKRQTGPLAACSQRQFGQVWANKSIKGLQRNVLLNWAEITFDLWALVLSVKALLPPRQMMHVWDYFQEDNSVTWY